VEHLVALFLEQGCAMRSTMRGAPCAQHYVCDRGHYIIFQPWFAGNSRVEFKKFLFLNKLEANEKLWGYTHNKSRRRKDERKRKINQNFFL
jgi:hypothetical protein